MRTVAINGQPWFGAAGVCACLSIRNATDAIKALHADERQSLTLDLGEGKGGGIRTRTFISESGLYKLIMRSDKPEARRFQDWVTRDVLPAIRKDGGYVMGEEKVKTGEVSGDELVLRAMTMLKSKVERLTSETKGLKGEVKVLVDTNAALVNENTALKKATIGPNGAY